MELEVARVLGSTNMALRSSGAVASCGALDNLTENREWIRRAMRLGRCEVVYARGPLGTAGATFRSAEFVAGAGAVVA